MTSELLSCFAKKGYAHLPSTFDGKVLGSLQQAVGEILETCEEEQVLRDDFGRLVRLNGLMAHAPRPIQEVLSSAAILHILRELEIGDLVPILESLFIKRADVQDPVLWHQDCIYDRSWRAVVIGVYLGDAAPFQGALEFVPGSQSARQEMSCSTIR